jgi:2-polyprenyl-6-hydroxyphenyl methylase/3-demethylubiquinone-9 3-methyltransferase
MSAHPGTEGRAAAATAGSVDAAEVAKFAELAASWWDPEGEMRPLHRMNPIRLAYLRDAVCARFGRDPRADKPLAGLTAVDVGCGAGLISEPLARLGAEVLGIDAAAESLEAARAHAAETGLAELGARLSYRQATAEELGEEGARFDLVVSLEVVEHTPDPEAFLAACGRLVAPPRPARGQRPARPGGLLVASTLNRTLKSLAMAKLGAEYLLRWLPAGTHDWRKFVKPHEAAAGLRAAGLAVTDASGLIYNPLTDSWRRSGRDLDVNYMMTAVRETA